MRDKVIQLIKTITVKKTIIGVAKLIIYEDGDMITFDTEWKNKEKGYIEVIHVIVSRLTIQEGVTLTIEDDTKVLFVNSDGTYGQVSQLIFESGSELDVGNFVSYAIDPEVLDKISFEVLYGWNKGYDILPRSKIANNGGFCFYGNNRSSKNKTSEISGFSIGKFSGECLGNTKFAALNIYDMQLLSTQFDSITLNKCNNCLNLNNSDVKIKKCLIENAENGFVINESYFTVIVQLTANCQSFINADFDGSLTFVAGTVLDIAAEITGANLEIDNAVITATERLTLTSNGKPIEENYFCYNAVDPLVDQTDPEEIGAD